MSNEPAGDRAWDESLFNVDLPTAHMKGTSSGEPSELGQGAWLDGPLTSNVSKMTGTNTSKAASDHAAAMSAVIKELQLDDWEIKPNEIEIMKEPNGEQCKLGEGAFGSVSTCSPLPSGPVFWNRCGDLLEIFWRSPYLWCWPYVSLWPAANDIDACYVHIVSSWCSQILAVAYIFGWIGGCPFTENEILRC